VFLLWMLRLMPRKAEESNMGRGVFLSLHHSSCNKCEQLNYISGNPQHNQIL